MDTAQSVDGQIKPSNQAVQMKTDQLSLKLSISHLEYVQTDMSMFLVAEPKSGFSHLVAHKWRVQ